MAIGMGRFECERPRLWSRTEGPPAEPERAIPPLPIMERSAEDEALAARHRAEAEETRRVLREQGQQAGGKNDSSSPSPAPAPGTPFALSKPSLETPSGVFRRSGGGGGLLRGGASPRMLVLPDGTTLQEIQSPRIDYPAAARRAGLQGVVEVAYWVAPDGSVSGLEIARSVRPVLDQLVLDGVALARYAPRDSPNAKPVKLTRPATFSLNP
jgi:TonB family protein